MRAFGDRIFVCYEGMTEDGDVFDRHGPDNPLEVSLGMHALPKGLERALLEMDIGEERVLALDPEDAFGAYRENDVIDYPFGTLEDAQDLRPGDIIRLRGNKSGMRPAYPKVVSNDGFTIRLDFNHPMAGKVVVYRIQVVNEEKRSSTMPSR